MDELITVFTTRDIFQAEMIRMALSEEGIKSRIENEHQAGLSGVLDVKVYVMSDDAERAKQLVADLEREESQPYRLAVITFDNESEAEEVQLALKKLEKSYLVDLKDSVVIVKNQQGEIVVHQTHHLTRDGALAGGVLGAIVGTMFLSPGLGFVAGAAAGAATGALSDIGIDDDFLEEVGESLQSKSSALVVLVRRADDALVVEHDAR